MTKEEIKEMQNYHYKKIKGLCQDYCDNEFNAKFTVVENIINNFKSFEDKRLVEIDKLIHSLIEERNRIIELNRMSGSDE